MSNPMTQTPKLEPAPARYFGFLNADDLSIDGEMYSAEFVRKAVKEYATLLSQVRQKDEALRNIEARLALRAKCDLDGGDFRYMEGQIEAALSPVPQPDAAPADGGRNG